MSVFAQTARKVRNIWSHGEDEEYEAEEHDGAAGQEDAGYRDSGKYAASSYEPTYSKEPSYTSSYGGSGGSGGSAARRLRPVAMPLRAREKNIYTLKPKTQDEAAIAADYMKSGSAVVLNLESVERADAVRIIDFMSGVCYGLDGQGHAMKLGDAIFLFTPAEFEISSDEIDYAENREFFFKDVQADGSTAPKLAAAPAATPGANSASASYQANDRRSWER